MYQKKKIRLVYLIVFLFFAGFLLLYMPMKANAAVKLNRTSKTMYVGDKMTLQVMGTTKKVKWKSSNSAVAKVTSKGVVLARKRGGEHGVHCAVQRVVGLHQVAAVVLQYAVGRNAHHNKNPPLSSGHAGAVDQLVQHLVQRGHQAAGGGIGF